jgi:hypothetical protein
VRPLWEGVDPMMNVQELADYLLNLVNKGYADYEVKTLAGPTAYEEQSLDEGSIEIKELTEEVLL